MSNSGLSNPASLRRAWWIIAAIFLIHGLVVSTWVSRIPAVQHQLHLSNGVLGLALLGAAAGSVLATPLCGWMVIRYGSKKVTGVSSLGFCFSLILIPFAYDAVSLGAALILFGGFGATMDVSMNAQAVEVERAFGRPSMSRFHAMFSLGGMAGAGLGGAVAARGVSPSNHFMAAALVLSMATAITAPGMLASPRRIMPKAERLPLSQIPPELFAISAIAFCMLLSEGAMADWTAVYFRQGLGAGPGTAAAGYAVFSAAMAIFRLLGDAITLRLGAANTVRFGSLVAAAGLLWALAQTPSWAFPGFAAAGAGFSAIVPLAFGAGGRIPGVSAGAGIATITGLGYIGFLVGPPLIGFIAQMFTLRHALGIVVLVCLTSSVLARWLPEKVQDTQHARAGAGMSVRLQCGAILFDMDGTIVDSTAIVEGAWRWWAERHNIPLRELLTFSHGRPTVDTIEHFLGPRDHSSELAEMLLYEEQVTEGITAIPGAVDAVAAVRDGKWAVVTSAPRRLAEIRLEAAGLPSPSVLVGVDEIYRGKPDPQGYLLAAERLHIAAAQCLVFEDTGPGIEAGLRAGMQAVGLLTTVAREQLRCKWVVRDFRDVKITATPAGFDVRLYL